MCVVSAGCRGLTDSQCVVAAGLLPRPRRPPLAAFVNHRRPYKTSACTTDQLSSSHEPLQAASRAHRREARSKARSTQASPISALLPPSVCPSVGRRPPLKVSLADVSVDEDFRGAVNVSVRPGRSRPRRRGRFSPPVPRALSSRKCVRWRQRPGRGGRVDVLESTVCSRKPVKSSALRS